MRLWQKIFLLTLFLTALAVSAISLLLLARSHRNTLLLAKEKIQTVRDSAVAELGHLVQERKDDSGQQLLTESDLEDLFVMFCLTSEEFRKGADGATDEAGSDGAGIPDAGERAEREDAPGSGDAQKNNILITPLEAGIFSAARLPREAGSAATVLVEKEGIRRISTCTTAFWEGRFYRVEVSGDVTDLFRQFEEDLRFCQWMCGGVSLAVATVLLFSILWLTRPLKRLEAATERIAAGEYGYRVPAKGHDEIAELSNHMNVMSGEIEDNIRKVEALAASRETFIANMSHELKTPLTSILGFADIMTIKSHMEEAERREYAAIIAAEAGRLKALSAKLMELVSLQGAELVLRPVELDALVERVALALSPVCRAQQCTVQRDLEPVTALADEALLTSLVMNLLDNALKASALKGHGRQIDISLKKEYDKAVMKVRDYGIGIPGDQLEHVTEAFYMVDKARSRQSGGSGIGLSLCKAIARAHRGSLRIESREGQGTEVSLILPVPDTPPSE
nr:HAMP domain-containing sensor histidine kinase [uncultured Acetatifactor sp.]